MEGNKTILIHLSLFSVSFSVFVSCSIVHSEPNNLRLSFSLTDECGLKEEGCHPSRSVPVPAV